MTSEPTNVSAPAVQVATSELNPHATRAWHTAATRRSSSVSIAELEDEPPQAADAAHAATSALRSCVPRIRG